MTRADGKMDTMPTAPMPTWMVGLDANGKILTPAMSDMVTATKQFQVARIQTNTDGEATWTYPTPFANGVVPDVIAIAEGPDPAGTVQLNAQLAGPPTNTAAKLKITKSNLTVVGLLGLTILSIPATVGATWIHVIATVTT